MNWAEAVVLIVLISAIVQAARARHGGGRSRRHRDDGRVEQAKSARELQLEHEVDDLRERIHVLERIATDGNSIDARETRRIAEEIEALRDETRN